MTFQLNLKIYTSSKWVIITTAAYSIGNTSSSVFYKMCRPWLSSMPPWMTSWVWYWSHNRFIISQYWPAVNHLKTSYSWNKRLIGTRLWYAIIFFSLYGKITWRKSGTPIRSLPIHLKNVLLWLSLLHVKIGHIDNWYTDQNIRAFDLMTLNITQSKPVE